MARVTIIGGHGKVALRLAPLLAARGDDVVSVVRNPDHVADVEATGARAVVADVEYLDVGAVADLLRDRDAIVWSAGAGGGDPARTRAVDHDAALRSIRAAEAAGVRRYVMVSYLGSRPDHGVRPDHPFFAYAEAKAAVDEHLRASHLDWTILGPGPLTDDDPTGHIEVADPGEGRVSRADVAAVIAAVLADDTTIGRTIRFGVGRVPIPEALRD